MRIVIDLQGAQSESSFRGIGRYSMSIALAVARQAVEHEVWLVLNSRLSENFHAIQQAFEGLVPPERIRVFDVPAAVAEIDANNAWRARAAEKIREYFIQQLQPDAVLVTSLFEGYADDAVTSVGTFCGGANTAVILYDLIPLLNPSRYLATSIQKQYYDRKVQSLKNAGLLLAISDHSRQEAIDALGLRADRVVSISTAVDEAFKPQNLSAFESAELLKRFCITRKMVLCAPGGFDARKNIDGLIKAYSLLSSDLRAGHQLVVVSKLGDVERSHLETMRKQAGLAEDELVLTGYVTDKDLIALYSEALLFVFPSKHEGFGLPALEAMACGSPVIGSNTTSVPEVIGLSDALFDPLSPHSIAEKMAQTLLDAPFRERLRVHGLSQAKKFSWDESAKRALEALQILGLNTVPMLRPQENSANCSTLVKEIAEIAGAGKPSDVDLVRVADCIAFNIGRETPRQLMLDISELMQRDAKSGIQRVVRSLLLELLENPPQNTDVRPIYFDGARFRYANAFTAAFTGNQLPNEADEIVDFCQDDIYLALDLNAHLTKAVHDLHMRLQCRGVQLHFIVYDILLVQRPDWWPEGTSVIFEAWLRSISEVATKLICISEAVADEVRSWLLENPPARKTGPAVVSFHLGADVENSVPSKDMPDDAAIVLDHLRERVSFLSVGTIEPRKGHTQILDAFELLWKQGFDINLVFVGRQGWLVDQLADNLRQHSELNKRLFWLEGISDEYLQKIYTANNCLIAASEGEGFGLPLIEAAQHKLPIIARDIPVFREVAGEYALYFSGLEPQVLANTVKNWLSLNAEGNAPQSVDMPWLTWKQSTQQLLSHILPEVLTENVDRRELECDKNSAHQRTIHKSAN